MGGAFRSGEKRAGEECLPRSSVPLGPSPAQAAVREPRRRMPAPHRASDRGCPRGRQSGADGHRALGAGSWPGGPRPRQAGALVVSERGSPGSAPHLLFHAVDNDGRVFAAEPAKERRDSHSDGPAGSSSRVRGPT